MTTPQPPAAELRPRRSRKGLVGVFATGLVMLVGVPAALAAVWSVNEVQSEWTLTDCLSKSDGADAIDFSNDAADNFYIDFDPTSTNTDAATGATVLQETLTVRAPAGFYTYSSDTFRVNADQCGYDFDVNLSIAGTNSFGEDALAGNWADKGVELYLSTKADPNDDFTSADWDQAPLVVDSTGAIVNDETGTAVLADDSYLHVGFKLAGGAPAGATGELKFQVEFSPKP